MMEKDLEEFIKFRCKEIILSAGINPELIDIDACVRSYKAGASDAMKILNTKVEI
jgi:hypothetical protein